MHPQPLRQGDVYLEPVKKIPDGARPLPREQGRVVLALGEHTGHAHTIASPKATLFEAPMFGNRLRYLDVVGEKPVTLAHIVLPTGEPTPDHRKDEVPPGTYRVRTQRQFDPNDPQRVPNGD